MEAIKRRLDKVEQHSSNLPLTCWCKVVPIKVLCFIWMVAQGRIPSATTLQSCNMNIERTVCGTCIGEFECADHILMRCSYVRLIMNMIFEWCGINIKEFYDVGEVLHFVASWGRCPKKRIKLLCIYYNLLWNLWRIRNDRLFRGLSTIICRCTDNIKVLPYLWLKCRVMV
uniref:Reverse transcriptase zinc-binding domain-containing protein n=1 Tax=Lactuca sativa TaxID=4236 RepID=A0A9R1VSZ5_LACSA|nr:hypothetical protein LSAT_V11C400224050 [Lactuca sativa]